VKQYKSEQEDLLRVGINVAAYQLAVIEKVSEALTAGEADVDDCDDSGC
jgi:hypothetical protein